MILMRCWICLSLHFSVSVIKHCRQSTSVCFIEYNHSHTFASSKTNCRISSLYTTFIMDFRQSRRNGKVIDHLQWNAFMMKEVDKKCWWSTNKFHGKVAYGFVITHSLRHGKRFRLISVIKNFISFPMILFTLKQV